MIMRPEISDLIARHSHLKNLEALGVNAYPAEPFRPSHQASQLRADFDSLQGSTVSIAGRLTALRDHKKIMFGDIEDASGNFQAVLMENRLNGQFPIVQGNYDPGDFIGVSGTLDKTRAGEPSIFASEVTMLAKALRSTPQKVTDPEVMQRQRYLELLTDPKARDRFRTRSKIVQGIREHYLGLGALEVETPVLDNTYGGASARPFVTHHNALDSDVYLRIANELYLKRLTSAFQEGVFEFSKDFRNEGMDKTHNPEFTQVEIYMPNWDYHMMMDTTEEMVEGIVQKLHGSTKAPFGEHTIDYARPWRRLAIYDGLRDRFRFDPETISDDSLVAIAEEHGVGPRKLQREDKMSQIIKRCGIKSPTITDHYTESTMRGELLMRLFELGYEKELIQPTFVMDYPTDTSALAKAHRSKPGVTERFELYAGGMEIGNCYTELNDPREQRDRFETENLKQLRGDKEAMPVDEDFVVFQEYGMPPQSGMGFSIDRSTMLLTDTPHIRQVILFPTLKKGRP